MEKEIEAFRKQVARWRGERRQGARPYPDTMKVTALALWDRLRGDGATADSAAKRVGISTVTLEVWRTCTGRNRLVPVQLVAETRPAAAAQVVCLLSPKGYRIEAPDVATAAALLREVG
jgi:hypothetical protein